MHSHIKFTLKGFLIGLLLFVMGCNANNPRVVIPAEKDVIHWYLSPSGDKLLYDVNATRDTYGQAFIRFLATDRDMLIPNCPQFRWLDNDTVYCFKDTDEPVAVIGQVLAESDTFSEAPIKLVTSDQDELKSLLMQATAIYRSPQYRSSGNVSLLLSIEKRENKVWYYHITEVQNSDELLKSHEDKTTSLFSYEEGLSGKNYSPDKAYYYSVQQDGMKVYDASNDRLLATVKRPTNRKTRFSIGGGGSNQTQGWAADSSGVYFQLVQTIGLGPRPPLQPIQKLCVPGASGCSPAN